MFKVMFKHCSGAFIIDFEQVYLGCKWIRVICVLIKSLFFALREKFPDTEFFLVRIFPYLSVFSPNAGKYGPEETPYFWILFTQCCIDNTKKIFGERSVGSTHAF